MNAHSDSAALSDSSTVIALVALGVAGASVFLAMPVIASALSRSGLSDRQVGTFSFLQLSCISIGCVASLWIGRRANLRVLATLSLTTLFVMDAASAFVTGSLAFLAVRAVAGAAGGVGIATTTAMLGRTRLADRNFGWFVFCQIVFQMIAVWQLPRLVSAFGIRGLFLVFALADVLILLILVRRLPAVPLESPAGSRGHNERRVWAWCAVVMLSILSFFTAVGAFWTFIARIAEQSVPLSSSSVGSALSIAAFGGLTGASSGALRDQARAGAASPHRLRSTGRGPAADGRCHHAGDIHCRRGAIQLWMVSRFSVSTGSSRLTRPRRSRAAGQRGAHRCRAGHWTRCGHAYVANQGLAASGEVSLTAIAVSAALVFSVMIVSRPASVSNST